MLYRYSNLFKGTDDELNHIQIIHSIIHINQIRFKKNIKYRCLPDLGINKTKNSTLADLLKNLLLMAFNFDRDETHFRRSFV